MLQLRPLAVWFQGSEEYPDCHGLGKKVVRRAMHANGSLLRTEHFDHSKAACEPETSADVV